MSERIHIAALEDKEGCSMSCMIHCHYSHSMECGGRKPLFWATSSLRRLTEEFADWLRNSFRHGLLLGFLFLSCSGKQEWGAA